MKIILLLSTALFVQSAGAGLINTRTLAVSTAPASADGAETRVVSAESGRAVLDRGASSGVERGDAYRIMSPNGFVRRYLEIDTVGDKQSGGSLHVRLIDRIIGEVSPPQAGDAAQFVGHGRPHWVWGVALGPGQIKHGETRVGGGLLLDYGFYRAWSVEAMFGGFSSQRGTFIEGINSSRETYTVVLPVWVKRNFFPYSATSPFIGAGLAYQRSSKHELRAPYPGYSIDETTNAAGIAPLIGAGLDQRINRRASLRLDVRYIRGKSLSNRMDVFFVTAGILTDWLPAYLSGSR